MSEQDTLREGIIRVIEKEMLCTIPEVVGRKVVKYLHDNDMVRKVERELPELRTIPSNARETKEIKITIPSWWDDMSVVSYLGKIHQQDMLKAGYTATEPLI